MNNLLSKRSSRFIAFEKAILWPIIRFAFRLKIKGVENIPFDRPILYISNHNSGALIESHSSLFVIGEKLSTIQKSVLGFTHPSIFKIPLIKHYFELIGAVPATYEVAKAVFQSGNSLMIFPGGNKQALRSIFQYKKNNFSEVHGWAKIAKENQIDVIPITFKGSHFINPIFFSNEWISKILVIPWLLGLKTTSVSLGQILLALMSYYFFHSYILAYVVFILTPIAVILPVPIEMTIHSGISHTLPQNEIEDRVKIIMDNIYK